MLPRIPARAVDWMRAHRQFGVEISTNGSATWVYIRTWKASEVVRVAVAIIDRYYGDANSELAILGKILSAVGITRFSLWKLSHSARLLEGVSWEWLHKDPCRLPHF